MALGQVRRYGRRRWRNRMTAKRMIILCAAVVVICLGVGLLPDDAYAQGSASRRGVSDSLAGGNPNEGKGTPPTKTQIALGVGSFIVMIIVVKWL